MAVPNMLVTLTANTTGFNRGLRKAATESQQFSKFAGTAFMAVGTALAGLGVAFLNAIPDLVKLGVESRKADARLEFMALNMTKLGESSGKTVAYLKNFADVMQKKTGIDDEEIKGVQAMLLLYPKLAKTAGKLGGAFDRVTTSAFDLATLGFGEASSNAKKLAKFMEDPIKRIDSLSKLGIVFTDAEKKKAAAIEKTNGKLAAAEYLLGIIEGKTKGISEKTASPLALLSAKFEEIGETIALRLLPRIDDVADKIGAWLDGPFGKKAIETISQAFQDFINWLGDSKNIAKIGMIADAMTKLAGAILLAFDAVEKFTGIPKWLVELMFGKNFVTNYKKAMGLDTSTYVPNLGTPGSTDGPPVVPDRQGSARITVNFNSPIDSVSAGREVARVLSDYNRVRGIS